MISGASEEELTEAIGRADVLLEFMPKIKQLQKENKQLKEVINKAIQLLEDNNICADIRRMKPKWNENKYGVEYELLDILKEVS